MASKQLGVWELPPQRLHSIVRSTSAVEPARNVGEHISFFCLIVAIPPHGRQALLHSSAFSSGTPILGWAPPDLDDDSKQRGGWAL